MKKIVKPTGNIRVTGRAEKDGVAFSAAKELGPMGVSTPKIFATVDENSEITCYKYSQYPHSSRIFHKINRLSETTRKVAWILFSIFLVAYLVCGIMQTGFENIFFILSYIMLSATELRKVVTIFIARIFGDKELKSFSKFMAAKNAVQNAYYDLEKIPNIYEAKKYSTFSFTSEYIKDSAAAFVTFFIPFSIIFPSSLSFISILLLACILFFIVIILAKNNMLFFWQFLILSKPESIHYAAAIKALEESVGMANSIKMRVTSVQISGNDELNTFSEEKCKGCNLYDLCKEIVGSAQKNDNAPNSSAFSDEE